MNRMEQYVDDIVTGLPLTAVEQEEMREEMLGHLMEHVDDLMLNGYTKNEAVEMALASFGNGSTIQLEMKKVLFPYYKFVRFGICTFLVTVMLCAVSHFITQYYFPRNDPAITVPLFFVMLMICVVVLGVLELVIEMIEKRERMRWVLNPWVLLFVPALLLQVGLLANTLSDPERTDYWIYNDYLFHPLYVIFYVVCRQLFTWFFVRKSHWRKSAARTLR